jgi:hypothetical protein
MKMIGLVIISQPQPSHHVYSSSLKHRWPVPAANAHVSALQNRSAPQLPPQKTFGNNHGFLTHFSQRNRVFEYFGFQQQAK